MYVTDTLKIIAENTSNMAGGKAPSVRWIETIESMEHPEEEEEKTAEEVIDHIKEKLAKM